MNALKARPKCASFSMPDNDRVICPEGEVIIVTNTVVEIINKLTGKAKCVYSKMVDNNNNINWILKNFQDGSKPSQFNLKFVMSTTLDDKANASTSKYGNTFTIKINENTLSTRTHWVLQEQ